MSSSMLAGERRWAPARRGSMTVLGKVTVPKPLNLPSQRLENHGLDPNVEIVPKGSLSWGSRSSSSASNPWGSSAQSPNADGGTGSPSHASGRPSSGGSGTRPSTAGSDRMHESTASAWGPNSRPSSASGALASNQTSVTSLRPRSAETRPGSSQLSRFAEPVSDNSVAWGPTGIMEKLVVASSKNDGFSLSSGDFPTLGSERDDSGKNTESQDHGSHGRPSSSSGRVALAKERAVTSQADTNSGTVNTWKRDGNQHGEDGVQPIAEKWQRDPQQYMNANIPPQHFEAWHGPPMNAPAGVWYRGPPGGPPYPPVAHGGFPIEPFPYYRPQIPPPALANSQPVPPPGAGPRSHHPNNGDLYRPQMPDAYIRPGMPIRPSFYPGPVAYEGYYGPPMGYCNSNEREIPFMGMAASPTVYNRYSPQCPPEPSNTHAIAVGRGSTGKTLVSEQVESGHSEDTRGPYKVLLKQHNEWDAKEEEENLEYTASANVLFLEKGDQPRTALQKNEWGADNRRDEEMHSRRKAFGENSSSQNFGNRQDYSSDSFAVKTPERIGKAKAVDDSWEKKSDIVASSIPQVRQVLPATPNDSTLIQKIEGLNAKARASDGRHNVASASSMEEQKSRLQVVNAKGANSSTNEVGSPALRLERTHATGDLIPATCVEGASIGDTTLQSTAASGMAISRRAFHSVQGRVDHRGKGKFNNQDADEWRKKPLVAESYSAVSAVNLGPASGDHAHDHHNLVDAIEKSETLPGKDEGVSLTPMFDPSDCQAQRTKMRELAKQRAIQLQKEEEERIREQKAKALAKLEELNRRTQVVDDSSQQLEKAPSSGDIQQEQEESWRLAESVVDATKYEAPSSALVTNPIVIAQISESSTRGVGETTVLPKDLHLETPNNPHHEPVIAQGPSVPSKLDVQNAGAADSKAPFQVYDSSVARHKRMGYKQKQNVQVEKNLTEKLIPINTTEAPKSPATVHEIASTKVVPGEVGSSCESSLPNTSNILPESSAHQRKKNNRSSKDKYKLDDASPVTAVPSTVPKETNSAKSSTEIGKPKASQSELNASLIQSVTDVKDDIQPSEQHCSLPSEEAHGRVHNHFKSQHSRRMPRNPQANRVADKFHGSDAVIWAPVRSQNKAEAVDEARQRTVPDAVTTAPKSDTTVQNSLKSKRAEMERYVPKLVAKEIAQQGSIQQSTPSSFSQSTLDETAGRAESGFQSTGSYQPASSAIVNAGSSVDSRNGDSKQNKQAKAHGAWRQRGSTETPRVQGLQQGSSSSSNPAKNVPKSMDQHEILKPEVNSVKPEQPWVSDEWNTSDGWNIPEYPKAAEPVASVVKDQGGITGKGKRPSYKGYRNTGNDHDVDHKNVNSGETTDKINIQSAAVETIQTDKTLALKENRGIGERTSSHWQPKSHSANNQRGTRSRGGQNVTAEVGRDIKKDSPPQGRVRLPPQQVKESSEIISQHHPDHSVSESKNVGEAPNVGHQEARRERKVASSKGRSRSPNQGFVSSDELGPPAGMDARLEQRFSSEFPKNGSPNNRTGRGNESRGDWNSSGQDNRQHNIPANRERQRQNPHYEYQPVGSYNNSKSNNFEGPSDDSRNMGPRYRERAQGHSRRGGGNYYGRQGGTVRVDAGYD